MKLLSLQNNYYCISQLCLLVQRERIIQKRNTGKLKKVYRKKSSSKRNVGVKFSKVSSISMDDRNIRNAKNKKWGGGWGKALSLAGQKKSWLLIMINGIVMLIMMNGIVTDVMLWMAKWKVLYSYISKYKFKNNNTHREKKNQLICWYFAQC